MDEALRILNAYGTLEELVHDDHQGHYQDSANEARRKRVRPREKWRHPEGVRELVGARVEDRGDEYAAARGDVEPGVGEGERHRHESEDNNGQPDVYAWIVEAGQEKRQVPHPPDHSQQHRRPDLTQGQKPRQEVAPPAVLFAESEQGDWQRADH